jgi:hypothetical protein
MARFMFYSHDSFGLAAAEAFRPDVTVVDKSALGLRGELHAVLRVWRGRSRLVLGLPVQLEEFRPDMEAVTGGAKAFVAMALMSSRRDAR